MHVPLTGLQHAVRLVDSLTELDDPAGFAELALPALARLVGCDSVSFIVIGAEPGQVAISCHPASAVPAGGATVLAAYVHEHPLVSHYRQTGDGQPVMISDFLSRRRFHRLRLYCEFFRHIPVEYQIAFGLPGSGRDITGIALNRAASDFSEDDRDLLGVLRLPLTAALERARQRRLARDGLAAATRAAAGLTDREVRVLHMAALGRTNSAIAHALDVSPRTVAKHLEHIYRKLDVTSRASAVFTALARMLVSEADDRMDAGPAAGAPWPAAGDGTLRRETTRPAGRRPPPPGTGRPDARSVSG